MGVTKVVLQKGNGADKPVKGQTVAMEYTVGRGELKTNIGVGRVIRGWDEGILGNNEVEGMTLGEKATLTISADFGYGSR
ncbi:hypothetical protein BU24DRAFT_458995 [Aaosphaeria arxii CBS 175.79]|uniref:peptidylprolyl isomerase n=1 Tax=Aaosphaeria arxii CBS 175.79 TaxID=1450172 RepID=A0A6A5Y1F8_9PLEO|nr:uncharacterized protein BU24DRAFT_458995 [Aaosphaeria arxii CBS 175.79]KAF2019308.1 hypothetical protein BU24DRAFT_458995 [Aaosphaeria arxii CBS 175.79]